MLAPPSLPPARCARPNRPPAPRPPLPRRPAPPARATPLDPAAAEAIAAVLDAFVGSPLKLAGTLALSFASYRAILYFRIQYLLASHLSNNVPAGSRILQYGSGGYKGVVLNYYRTPAAVYLVGDDADDGLLQQVAAGAGVPSLRTQKAPVGGARVLLDAGSADAAVSVGALGALAAAAASPGEAGGGPTLASALSEAARVLKPGKPLLFFEERGGVAPGALTRALEASGQWKDVRYDGPWAAMPLSPVAIGIALRSDAPTVQDRASAGGAAAAAAGAGAGGRKGGAAAAAPQQPPRGPRGVAAPAKGFGARPPPPPPQ